MYHSTANNIELKTQKTHRVNDTIAKPYDLGCPPSQFFVANEGLGWDSLLKMVHNPGGDS